MNAPCAEDYSDDEHISRPPDEYAHPADKMFTIYLKEAEKVDRQMVEDWKETTDGILIFAGLFSAVVTAFLIESYKGLSPDPDTNGPTVALLAQISSQHAVITNSSQPSNIQLPTPKDKFYPSTTALAVNAMWFLSLSLSLVCAVAATSTLVQYWARCYTRSVERFQQSPHKRALIRALMFEGLEWSHVSEIVDAIPTLIHIALFLFLTGLVTFLHDISLPIAYFVLAILSSCAVLYAVAAILPLLRPESTLRTPFSSALWYTWQHCSRLLPSPKRETRVVEFISYTVPSDGGRIHQGYLASHVVDGGLAASTAQSSPRVASTQHLTASISKAQEQRASVDGPLHDATKKRMARALTWIHGLANEDHEFEAFVMAIPGLSMWEPSLFLHFVEHDTQLLIGIRKLFHRTMPFLWDPVKRNKRRIRAIACMKAMYHLIDAALSVQVDAGWEIQKELLLFVYDLMRYISRCDKEDISLAFCTMTACLSLREPTLSAVTREPFSYQNLNGSRRYIDRLLQYTPPASPTPFSPFAKFIRFLAKLSAALDDTSVYKHILAVAKAAWDSEADFSEEFHQEICFVKFLDKLLVEYSAYPAEPGVVLSSSIEALLEMLIKTTTSLSNSAARDQAISALSKYLDSNPVYGVTEARTTLDHLKAETPSDPGEIPGQEEGSPTDV